MAQVGFISGALEIKFLILYIAARLVEPVPFEILQDLAMCDDGVDYFDFADCLADLVRTEHLTLDEKGRYAITDKGRSNSEICESGLAYTVRMRAERNIAVYNQKLRRNSLVTAEISVRKSGSYTLSLSLSDELENVMKLDLLVTQEATALELQKRFREQGEKIYGRIIKALFEEDGDSGEQAAAPEDSAPAE